MAKFTEEALDRMGVTKLDLLLTHVDQSPGASLPEDPREYEITVPCSDGSQLSKKIKNCSTSEIRRSLPNGKIKKSAVARGPQTPTTDHQPARAANPS
jgi:hypothetical protein